MQDANLVEKLLASPLTIILLLLGIIVEFLGPRWAEPLPVEVRYKAEAAIRVVGLGLLLAGIVLLMR